MTPLDRSALPRWVALAAPPAVAAFLLLFGLGGFGLWEPHETERAGVAAAIIDGDEEAVAASDLPGAHIGERLTALAWTVGPKSELSARLPLAILGVLAVLALVVALAPLTGSRDAVVAGLVLAASPVMLFHCRQLTSGAPLLLGEVLSISGLALLAYGEGRRTAAIGAAFSAAGLALGWLSAGLLIGVAVPSAAVFGALALTGDLAGMFSSGRRPAQRRQIAVSITGPLFALSAGTFLAVAIPSGADVPLITGGLSDPVSPPPTLDLVLDALAYGWFPWSALAPLVLLSFLEGSDGEDRPRDPLACLAVAGIAVGGVAHAYFSSVHGPSPLFLAVPVSVAAARGLGNLERAASPHRFGFLVAAVLLAVMIRDFAQEPKVLLSGFGFDDIPAPKHFKPVKGVLLATVPFAALLLLEGIAGVGDPPRARWRAVLSRVLLGLAALSFGAYVTCHMVPELSVDLSSKHVLDAYDRYASEGEPLGVYGPGRPPVEAKRLGTQSDVVEWLSRPERVFALFPPGNLAPLDRKLREAGEGHIHVLDSESERFLLATSRPRTGEENQNPLVEFVSSEPFDDEITNELEVDFDDKVTLLGWDLRSEGGEEHLVKGDRLVMTTYWRCDGRFRHDYKIFVHIDGPGPRIHGDHKPLKGLFPTREWREGDYIKDVHRRRVPAYQKAGSYRIKMGMFRGKQRLRVAGGAKADENAIHLGRIELK